GGYNLSRDASLINIADVIEAVDEQLDSTKCGGEANCQNNKACLTHDLWMGLSDQIRGYLQGISLGDLLEKHHVKEVAKRQEMDAKVIELHRMDRCQSLYK
ncbi:Rrf2 family transcriptional regulator, partial [Methylicorpusculum sp.]|uniref:Rrf2 family transcriptional regulator n=1 Tax=Methylicorpusculum sp. TaxID=2713644 RepID=UPI002AB90BFC